MSERDPKTGRFPKGRGGPPSGEGWGGPAKGASSSRFRKGDPAPVLRTKAVSDRAAECREKVLGMYEEMVDDASMHPMVRLTAGDKLLDRLEGKPVAVNVNHNLGDPSRLSDAELAAIAASGRDLSPPTAGDPPELPALVH
ncbi:MAG TPA: hypothetical protein VEX11_14755 [Acetobacteraceae bacterium]|nr:hypothetical protein [Acetobacteraceae bacterium]